MSAPNILDQLAQALSEDEAAKREQAERETKARDAEAQERKAEIRRRTIETLRSQQELANMRLAAEQQEREEQANADTSQFGWEAAEREKANEPAHLRNSSGLSEIATLGTVRGVEDDDRGPVQPPVRSVRGIGRLGAIQVADLERTAEGRELLADAAAIHAEAGLSGGAQVGPTPAGLGTPVVPADAEAGARSLSKPE